MRHARSLAVLLGASCAIGVARVPGFAQSNAVRWSAATSNAIDLRTHPEVVGVYQPATPIADDVALPPNLSFPAMYREAIERMVRRSPMFRRQCLRLASARHASVTLKNAQTSAANPKAKATIKRTNDGRLVAVVEIQAPGDLEELIAHELEHVIEQLDEVDLSARAALSGTGVRSCGDGTFETTRAVRIGRLVALQTREGN